MKVYTGGGDKGKTSLFSGERVAKSSLRIDSYGDIDELNSVLGALLASLPEGCQSITTRLDDVQGKLLQAGAWLATTPDSSAVKYLDEFPEEFAKDLEQAIDGLSAELPPLNVFILPAGHQAAGWAHIARTVCRRCERKVSSLAEEEVAQGIENNAMKMILVYLNRLSDYLFVAARFINVTSNIKEKEWKKG